MVDTSQEGSAQDLAVENVADRVQEDEDRQKMPPIEFETICFIGHVRSELKDFVQDRLCCLETTSTACQPRALAMPPQDKVALSCAGPNVLHERYFLWRLGFYHVGDDCAEFDDTEDICFERQDRSLVRRVRSVLRCKGIINLT